MFNTLLFIHLIIALLLIVVILLQKTNADGLSGIGGGGNMGLVSGRSAANFMTKTTIILAIVFFVNAIVLANLSTKNTSKITKKMETEMQTNVQTSEELQNASEIKEQAEKEETSLPIAK